MTYVDIQLIILEFKNSFGKYHPVCPELYLKGVLGHPGDNIRRITIIYNIHS